MSIPDCWVLVEWKTGEIALLCGFNGSYLYGASWKRSSPIKNIYVNKRFIIFTTSSGNIYKCHKDKIGFSSITASIANYMIVDDSITIHTEYDEIFKMVKKFMKENKHAIW